jgi:hypothetical protein
MTARHSNPDNDPRGPWKPGDFSARNYYGEGTYSITTPSGRLIEGPPKGRFLVVSKTKFAALNDDNRIWWGDGGDGTPAIKRFLSEVQDGVAPQNLWFCKDVGHTQEAKKELLATLELNSSDDVFETPKPGRLIKKMLRIAPTLNGNDINGKTCGGAIKRGDAKPLVNIVGAYCDCSPSLRDMRPIKPTRSRRTAPIALDASDKPRILAGKIVTTGRQKGTATRISEAGARHMLNL